MLAHLRSASQKESRCLNIARHKDDIEHEFIAAGRCSETNRPPGGVINVVTGLGHDLGDALVQHPDVSKVTFTGSDVTKAVVGAAAGKCTKRISMELGGKSPNIVFDVADLDRAVW